MYPIQYSHEIAALIFPFKVSDLRLNELRSLQGAIRNVVNLGETNEEKNRLIGSISDLAEHTDAREVNRARQILVKIRAELSYRHIHRDCAHEMGFENPCQCLGPNHRQRHYKKSATLMGILFTFWVGLFSVMYIRSIYSTDRHTNLLLGSEITSYPPWYVAVLIAIGFNLVLFYVFRLCFFWYLRRNDSNREDGESNGLLSKASVSRGYHSV